MNTTSIRLRYLIAKRGRSLAVVLLLVGALLLAGAGAVYATPPTTEVTDQTDKRTVTANLSTAATVTGNTSLYEQGTTLRDQPVYLFGATPVAELTLMTTLPEGADGSVEQRIDLAYSARRGSETFWQRTQPLATKTTESGSETTTTVSLSMRDVRDQLSAHRDEFGQAGVTSVAVRISVRYTVDQYEGTITETFPVTFGDQWYTIAGETRSQTHSTPVTRTTTIPVRDRLPFLLPGGVGLVLLLGGLLAGLTARRRDGVSISELADDIHHARYAEWISGGSLPEAASESVVRIDSLEALVDVAIDSRKRVVFDADCGRYAVLDGGVQYRYTPDAADTVTETLDDSDWVWADSQQD